MQKIGAFALSYKAFLFFQDNFLFSQKQIPIKLPLFIKHITYCLPKSKHAFSKTLTNPYAVKLPSRTGSKYSELYGTKRRFSKSFSDRNKACNLIKKSTARNFEPLPGSPEGRYFAAALRRPRSAFGYFSQRRKVTEKRSFLLLFRTSEKVILKRP